MEDRLKRAAQQEADASGRRAVVILHPDGTHGVYREGSERPGRIEHIASPGGYR